jgi:hypothetical protein
VIPDAFEQQFCKIGGSGTGLPWNRVGLSNASGHGQRRQGNDRNGGQLCIACLNHPRRQLTSHWFHSAITLGNGPLNDLGGIEDARRSKDSHEHHFHPQKGFVNIKIQAFFAGRQSQITSTCNQNIRQSAQNVSNGNHVFLLITHVGLLRTPEHARTVTFYDVVLSESGNAQRRCK